MKHITSILIVILLALTLIAPIYIGANYFTVFSKERTHEVPAVVDEVTEDCVVLVDNDGEAWVFEGDGYAVGQSVIIVFNDMGTDDIYDDEIIQIISEKKA